ncbi:MAG: carbohydrate ABC transporter permease [Burkholderiales bacterium]|nr:carbohydrate ABC transporter permease [Anaerolineae bacterium]
MSTALESRGEQLPAISERYQGDTSSRRWRKLLRRVSHVSLVYVLAAIGAIAFVLPFLWMLSGSLKPANQLFIMPPKWIPDPLYWQNYTEALDLMPFGRYLGNTLFITIGNVLGNLISCTLAAYGFARLRGPFKNVLFLLMLGTMMLPLWVTLIPQYILFSSIGWSNGFAPLMVPAWFGWPFFIFLLRQFFMTIPRELEEAARLDGASTWGIIWHIFIPLAKPALATVAVLGFIGNWNNFLTPLVYLRDSDLHTLSIAVNRFRGTYASVSLSYMMAISVLTVIPVIVVFFFSQRYLVKGIVMTGSKN